ncbi:phenylacetate--CoA ligase family protein [Amycolatopsis sp. 195334CR]|uniref:phenylacetate--CoA ligase family protein n=1 Tax=Amycolatopsis sp. 195334CR TaxID=2814588 RepID=UPI001A8FB321|nr:phenylacetate--CoA ligase family protein [Amycolatopsis sp. 195334CR]MBN6039034.1 phenylacetate--CoA ligase family protein [Amycolatopsis sp. 195334CR]
MSENLSWVGGDARRARKEGAAGIARRQRERLAEMVAFARAESPYYRELYRELPERVDDPALLPVTDKKTLMEHFDDWATDREITLGKVRAFVDDPALIGTRFLGRYLVATTSGTTGRRGLFVQDRRYQHIASALTGPVMAGWLGAGGLLRVAARGGKLAQLVATGGHYVGYASYVQVTSESRWQGKIVRAFSVHTPMPELVAQLNRYNPAVIVGYASAIQLLAAEQEAGRLHIKPILIEAAGETMTPADTGRLATAFGARVRTLYSCTECTYLSHSCADGWYHVNTDWATLEPVDADYRPTPPGELSHTVLISNLANRVQPFLRYDLGDRVLLRPDPCPCGSPLPAVRVEGRAGDVLTFPAEHGEQVSISPLAFGTLFDRTPGVELFQVEQTEPATLRVRMRLAEGADAERVWRDVHSELDELLTGHQLGHLTVERAAEPPVQAAGGKYRTVIPLSRAAGLAEPGGSS